MADTTNEMTKEEKAKIKEKEKAKKEREKIDKKAQKEAAKKDKKQGFFSRIFGGIADFFKGVFKEASRVRWPKFSELMINSGKVLVFCVLFAVFFIFCDFVVGELLLLIGIGG